MTDRSEPTAPASSFVPPRSTPMTYPSATRPPYRYAMADPRDDDKPQYTLYRSRPKFLRRRGDDGGLAKMQAPNRPESYETPPRTRPRRKIGGWRIVRWLAGALV